jgi:3-phenylpropionate/trans-cinnamate dioxygenase ferredoxin subunit
MSRWIRLGKIDDFAEGEPVFHDFEYETAVLFRVGNTIYAIEDRCTHDDGPLGEGVLDGCEIVCPRHSARFDIRTGEALTMPAVEDVPTYAVRVEDGDVFVEEPENGW